MADALSNLAATLALRAEKDAIIPVCNKWVVTPSEDEFVEEVNAVSLYEVEKEDWCHLLIDYLKQGKLPYDVRHKMKIQRQASCFLCYNDTPYQCSFLGLWLRCLGEEEAHHVMEEAYLGVCGVHQPGPKLCDRIKRMGYYWPTMVHDYIDLTKWYDACQFPANFIHQPLESLDPTVGSWPFEKWGLYAIGPLTPKSSVDHLYIITGTDYFSKWAEAIALKEVQIGNVVGFIRMHIIY